MTHTPRLALAALALVTCGCTLSGNASVPAYVCAAEDSGGLRITCAAPVESYPADGCQCATKARDGRGPDVFYGRVVAQ